MLKRNGSVGDRKGLKRKWEETVQVHHLCQELQMSKSKGCDLSGKLGKESMDSLCISFFLKTTCRSTVTQPRSFNHHHHGILQGSQEITTLPFSPFIFLMFAYVHMCMNVCFTCAGDHGNCRKVLHPLDLELQVAGP